MKAKDLIYNVIVSDCLKQSQIKVMVKKLTKKNGALSYKKRLHIFSTELRIENFLKKYEECDIKFLFEDNELTILIYDEREVNE